MKTFQDFVDLCCEQIPWPEGEVRRCLALHLGASGVTERDVEVYINYPAQTEAELAAAYGLSESAVGRTLARVRKAWPTLRRDVECRAHGSVSPSQVLPYEPWMDNNIVQKF